MTHRDTIKCNYCGTGTMIRMVIGRVDHVPLRVPCGKCKVLLKGMLNINQKEVDFKYNFENAEIHQYYTLKPEYYIELSGELFTKKLQSFVEGESYESIVMRQISTFSSLEVMNEFIESFASFINLRDNYWKKNSDLNNLYNQKNWDLLKIIFEKDGNVFEKQESIEYQCCGKIFEETIKILGSIIYKSDFEKSTIIVKENFIKFEKEEQKTFFDFYKEKIDSYDVKIFLRIEEFVNSFEKLLPIFCMKFVEGNIENMIKNMGITTVSFEEIKSLYIDNYELVLEISDLLLGFENLIETKNFQTLKNNWISGKNSIKKIDDYIKLTNGNKLNYLNRFPNVFSQIYGFDLDKEIRNSIGHNSYRFDNVTQTLIYKKNNGKEEEIDFIKFLIMTWDSTIGLIKLWYFILSLKRLEIKKRENVR